MNFQDGFTVLFISLLFILTLMILFVCFSFIAEPKKLYKIEYKKVLAYHSVIIEAKNPASAVKKFNIKYGRTCEVQNVTEVR